MAGQNSRRKKNKKNTDRKTSSSTFRRLFPLSFSSPFLLQPTRTGQQRSTALSIFSPSASQVCTRHSSFSSSSFSSHFQLSRISSSLSSLCCPASNFHFRISGPDHLAVYLCTLLQASPNRLHRRSCVAHLSTTRFLVSERLAFFSPLIVVFRLIDISHDYLRLPNVVSGKF